MELNEAINIIIYNTFVRYWYLWVFIFFLLLLTKIIKLLIKPPKKLPNPKIISKNKYYANNNIPSEEKGRIGENIVSIILNTLDEETYKVINDLKIRNHIFEAQIDHLIVSNFGIFVIETKNFAGIIYGRESTNYWTQKFPHTRPNKFLNPIKQNDWHIKVLKESLKKYQNIFFASIVVFLNDADLRVSTETHVIYTFDLLKTIYRFKAKTISDITRDKIYTFLNYINLESL